MIWIEDAAAELERLRAEIAQLHKDFDDTQTDELAKAQTRIRQLESLRDETRNVLRIDDDEPIVHPADLARRRMDELVHLRVMEAAMRNLAGKLKDENVSLVRMHEQAATQIASAEARVAELERENARLKELDAYNTDIIARFAEKLTATESELRQERLIRKARAQDVAAIVAEKGALRAWLNNNMTHYNTSEAGARPILAEFGKRVWYHVTDDCVSFPFSAAIDAALAELEKLK
jgi:hypothetical protein